MRYICEEKEHPGNSLSRYEIIGYVNGVDKARAWVDAGGYYRARRATPIKAIKNIKIKCSDNRDSLGRFKKGKTTNYVD